MLNFQAVNCSAARCGMSHEFLVGRLRLDHFMVIFFPAPQCPTSPVPEILALLAIIILKKKGLMGIDPQNEPRKKKLLTFHQLLVG